MAKRNPVAEVQHYLTPILESLQELDEMGGPDAKTYVAVLVAVQVECAKRIMGAVSNLREK